MIRWLKYISVGIPEMIYLNFLKTYTFSERWVFVSI